MKIKTKFKAIVIISIMTILYSFNGYKNKLILIQNNFGLPYVDLSSDTNSQFIVAREKGVYYGHPTSVRIKTQQDAEIVLTAYPEGGHATGNVCVSKSIDGGKTWQKIIGDTIIGKVKEVPTIHELLDKRGQRRLVIFSGLYPVRMSVSEDNGSTWSKLKPIGNWGGEVAMSALVPLKNTPSDKKFAAGKYMAFFHDEGRFINGSNVAYSNPKKWILYKTITNEGGLSWSDPDVIREDTLTWNVEPGVIRSPDGKELAMLVREESRRFNSQVMFSKDEGKTWSIPQSLPASLTGDRHVPKYSKDGRLVVVFRDFQKKEEPGPTEGDFVAWVGKYEDLKKQTPGQYRLRLLYNFDSKKNPWSKYDCGYSGLELLDDDTFLAITYVNYRKEDNGNNSVIATKFSLNEIDKKLINSKP